MMKKTALIKKIQEMINEASEEKARISEEAKKEKDRVKCRRLYSLRESIENYMVSLRLLKKFLMGQSAKDFQFVFVESLEHLNELEKEWRRTNVSYFEEHITGYTTVDLVYSKYYVQVDSLQSVLKK